MIYDSIENLKLYTGLGPNFKESYDFIMGGRYEKKAGRYDLSNGMYYMTQEYDTRPEAEGFFETHKKFIDLHYVLKGKERHDIAHVSAMKERIPYNAEKDMTV